MGIDFCMAKHGAARSIKTHIMQKGISFDFKCVACVILDVDPIIFSKGGF